ncbi:MAG: carbon-nitrogen hydrolase family protein [Phycisphaerae bacterium]|nr:carbon-nitrogen hydrolase family protein [Phycisphaerae bacterium]
MIASNWSTVAAVAAVSIVAGLPRPAVADHAFPSAADASGVATGQAPSRPEESLGQLRRSPDRGKTYPGGAKDLPGRQVKVSAIAIGTGGEHDQKLKLALEHLQTAGSLGVDIACLPEEFAGEQAEPISGPTTLAVAELARKHQMYVICPIREQAEQGRQYNTAVLIDRQGRVAGYYRKVFVFWGEGLNLSEEGVKVFDTDFGRISILTCFDANFAELWQDADQRGAEIVFWPSAYGGGMPLNGYAMCHNYCIVPVGRGNIIDATGRTMEAVEQPCPGQFVATLDLDRTIVHKDFNSKKVAQLLKEHKGQVEMKDCDLEGWYMLWSVKPGVRVKDLCRQCEIETLRDYRHRSRTQINQTRKNKGKI